MFRKNITLLFLLNIVFSQVSLSDINKIGNQQLDNLKAELQSKGEENIDTFEPTMEIPSPVSIKSNTVAISTEEYFGYNYFRKNISFYDNIPTPVDYKLGPGDEIIISLWGEKNSRINKTINKDGMIYFQNIGFINLSNQTIESAEIILIEELSQIYSTLNDKDNPSKLMLSLGKLKSINIYFSGHIKNPGINLVHPFSDIFSAIVQAGGVSDNGSLRVVQLIRNNQIIATVDFYAFFMNGTNTFSNIKLIDGDTIHIPGFKNRVLISGAVNRPSTYELLSNENISDLIGYASGLASNASSSIFLNQIIPVEERSSDDNAKTGITLDLKNGKLISLNNGDKIKVLAIPDVDVNVEVIGRVKSPGFYPVSSNSSLKSILDIAGGFEDPIFRKSIRDKEIIILRQDENQFYSLEISTSYEEAHKQQLVPNDKILVYENTLYKNNLTYRIEGEVKKPGTYPIQPGLSVGQALDDAMGLTELSSNNNVIIYQEFTELLESGDIVTNQKEVASADLDFILGVNSVIKVLPYENVVSVEGNVYNPGLIAHKRGLTVKDAIILAGGYKPYSIKKATYVKRFNGLVDKVEIFRGRFMKLKPGDTVFVPLEPSPSDFDITEFIADLSTTLANLATILFIIQNQTN